MGIGIQKIFAQLLFWLYEFLDSIFDMFRVLCGIDTVEYTENGETVSRSILEIFLESSAVTKAFFFVFLVAMIVCAVSVITAVVKNTVNMKGGERKSHIKTVGQGFGSIVITLVLGFMMVFGIWGSNQILGQVYLATSDNTSLSISNRLFEMSVTESYVYDYDKPQQMKVQATDENGNLLWETDSHGNPLVDENNNKKPLWTYETYYEYLRDDEGNYVMQGGWRNGHTANDIHFGKTTVDQVFGIHRKNMFDIEEKGKGYIKGFEPMVELDSFNMLTAYFVVIMVLIALVWSMLGLVKRVFDLVGLFIMLPLVSATLPLDEGARLKAWRETVISKVILAYGAVISVNIFMMVIPIIQGIDFGSIGWSSFGSNLFKMFMLIGGALCINGGQLLIARLFGTSAEESREMAQSARALLGGATAAGSMLHGAKNAVFGGKNKYGRETKGVMRALGKGAGVAGNVAGNILGGQAYRTAVSKVADKAGSALNALRGLGTARTKQEPTVFSGGSQNAQTAAKANMGKVQSGAASKAAPKTKLGAFMQKTGQKVGNAAKSVGNSVKNNLQNGLIGGAVNGVKAGRQQAKENAQNKHFLPGFGGTRKSKMIGSSNNTSNRVKDMSKDLLSGGSKSQKPPKPKK